MRIIDKVESENPNLQRIEIVAGTCPNKWGYKNIEKCDYDLRTCAKCWSREENS